MTPPGNMANGSRPQAPPILRTTIVHHFAWGVGETEGVRNLQIETPDGERIVLPFSVEEAQNLGAALMAPSVVRPGAAG